MRAYTPLRVGMVFLSLVGTAIAGTDNSAVLDSLRKKIEADSSVESLERFMDAYRDHWRESFDLKKRSSRLSMRFGLKKGGRLREDRVDYDPLDGMPIFRPGGKFYMGIKVPDMSKYNMPVAKPSYRFFRRRIFRD